MQARYSNPDHDARGPWKPGGLDARNYYSQGIYSITCPSGRVISGPPAGSYWRVSRAKFKELDRDKRIWWGKDGNSVPAVKRFLSEVKAGKVPQTLWFYQEVGHTQEAKKELLEFVEFENTDNVLDSVKPTRLIQRMLQLATTPTESDLVVDFFAGSAATAHAVLNQNREDGGNRRAIMVQLPEPLPVAETKLKTIADLGKKRVRQVIEKIKKERQGKLRDRKVQEDLGFKVFKLSRSNYRPWEGSEEKNVDIYSGQMELYVDPLLSGWKLEDVIWEVAIKEGYSLASTFKKIASAKNATAYRVSDPDKDQSFPICLEDKIKLEDLKNVQLKQDDLFICRDVALDDEAAANLALQCRLKTI